MTIDTESPSRPVKLYSCAKLPARCGAAQLCWVSESLSCASSAIAAATHGCTTNSTGTAAGLPAAFPADTITLSLYVPGASPAGLSWTCSHPGVDPPRGLNDSHAEPCAAAALHDSAPPSPAFLSTTESDCSAALPTAAPKVSWVGATLSVATGGGVVGSVST